MNVVGACLFIALPILLAVWAGLFLIARAILGL